MLNHLLLVACVCIVIAVILYFFYWNRFIALILGLAIRLMYWNQGASSIWVEIGSIHFSLLTGRILLKDIQYHSSNQTIKIVKGQIEWRYWIRRPTTEEDILLSRVGGEDHKQAKRSLSCRIQVSFQGFEWFLYNRTAAYDNILSQMESSMPSRPASRTTELRQTSQKPSALPASVASLYPPSLLAGSLRTPLAITRAAAWVRRQLPNLDPKDLLPLGIEVTKGAIICGNASTPHLLVAEFRRTEGTFGVVQSRSKYDLYKQILSLRFQHALVRLTPNEDYQEPMTATGELVKGYHQQCSRLGRSSFCLSYSGFARIWRHLKLYAFTTRNRTNINTNRSPQYHNPPTARGRKQTKKNLDDETPLGAESASLEYAVECKVLEAPVLELSYYVDVVGEVPPLHCRTEAVGSESIDIGNGGMSPEWGIDVIVRGGFLRYGPWADRQRSELQRAFFPPTYHDVEPFTLLKPGDQRMWTTMHVFIELMDDTTLNLPFREASKNWQWDGQSQVPQRPRKREPASIHITVGDRSSINYTMPMVAGPEGYEPLLEVHLDTIAVTSSLNDIRLVTAESCRIRGELPSPLKWNSERKWIFGVTLRQPVLFLIRDHINMFTDLAKDWTTGPPNDYFRFIPMLYTFGLEMHHFELNLYANDHNIIDKPLLKDENALLTVRGDRFSHDVEIPSNTFRPEATTIPFSIEMPDFSVNLSLPRWNTHALHAPKDGNSIGKIGFMRIDGSYRYFAEVRDENVEQLRLTFTTRDVAFKALGWSIRYFMVMRDNYFGSFTHFSTLFEYLDKRRKGLPVGDPINQKYRPGKANVLQVEMGVSVENGIMILPAGLPGYETSSSGQGKGLRDVGIGACVVLLIPTLQVQFRMHDYFMEMSLNIDTISGSIEANSPEKVTCERPDHWKSKETFLIEGIDITANRLFGPQPRTATYVCIWEVHLGHIKAIFSAWEGRILAAAGNAFRLNFADSPNAPAADYLPPIDPDITFLKFSLDRLDTTWRAGQAALVFSLADGLRLETNDMAGQFHRKVTSLRLPHVSVKVLLTTPSQRNAWLEAADLVADGYLDIFSAPHGWQDMARAQAAFVDAQDQLTGRAKRMFIALQGHDTLGRVAHKNGLFLPQPALSTTPAPHKPDIHSSPPRPTNTPTKLWRWSKLPHLSESEGEEGVSEADRDARLAKTRSETPLPSPPVDEDDQNMTSGDESDDEDLTDADTSDSDWSDLMADLPDAGTAAKPLPTHYTHLTRHFLTRFLDTPSLWDGSPFVLTRDRGPLGSSTAHRRSKAPRSRTSLPSVTLVGGNNQRDTTVFRFECCKNLELRITPLILPAATRLEEEMEMNGLSPELCIDSILASYLSGFSEIKKFGKNTVVDVRLSSVGIRVLQHIPVAEQGDPTISPSFVNPGQSRIGVVSKIDCLLDGCHMTGHIAEQSFALTGAFDNVSITLDTATDKRRVSGQPNSSNTAFTLSLSGFTATLVRGNLEVVWSDIAAELGHLGPEYMVATGLALGHSLQQLRAIYHKWNLHASAMTQNIFRDIIQSSGDKAIVDPLSTIQPSYLVQSGAPHELRIDSTFKFLFHLRNCLWHLEDAERLAFHSLRNDILPIVEEDIITLLQSRLLSLALDAETPNLTHLSVLEALIPSVRTSSAQEQPKGLKPAFNYITVRIQKFSILVLDPGGTSSSEFTLTHLVTAACVHPSDIMHRSMGMSRTSLRDRGLETSQKFSVSVGEVSLVVFPHLMLFAQRILRVRRHHTTTLSSGGESITRDDKASWDLGTLMSADFTFALHHLRIQAAAENLIFEFGTSGVQVTSVTLHRSSGDQPMDHSILFHSTFFRARSPADISKQSEQDILASLELTHGKVNVVLHQEPFSNMTLGLVFAIGGFHFSVPRSALRLYQFVEEWRADFLPGIDATLQTFLSELKKAPSKPASPTPSHSAWLPIYQVCGQVTSFGVSLQVMHGTWVSWEINNTIAYLKSSTAPPRGSTQCFGLQLASQVFSISSRTSVLHDAAHSTRVKLELPKISLTGHYDGSCVHTLALVEEFHLKVKPSHWDTLLAVQQKFGQDFNDLVILIQQTQLKRSATPSQKPPRVSKPWKYIGYLKMKGFRIGLEGLSSTLYLECEDIDGGIQNNTARAWHLRLSDLALSLAPRAAVDPRHPAFNRNHRSAFVIIDLHTRAESRSSDASPSEVLEITVTKIHAVMQPSSIGEVGDFIDHIQAEMLDRKEQRALELAAFKEKTKSILRTFEVKPQQAELKDSSWLNKYIVDLSIRNIGVAFPLTLDQDLELPQTGTRGSTAVRAFLFSVKSIAFGTQRGETGQAIMKGFSFQFVSRFRQSVPADFSGENHQTRNRLLYPEMTAQLRSEGSTASRHIYIGANVSGFILDLDSTIPDYVFSLIDVYRQGKDRVARLSASLPRTPSIVEQTMIHGVTSLEKRYTALPTSNVLASFTFLSGKVRVYSGSVVGLTRTRSFSHAIHEPFDEQFLEMGAEIFKLPVVSVWGEYRATPALRKISGGREAEPSILMFKSTVHSSENTLRPTLLPFLTELVSHVEVRMRKISRQTLYPPSFPVHNSPIAVAINPEHPADPGSGMQISFSLRIDQSKLELTCQPDVNVIAGLHWDSGGFVVNVSPGARKVTFTGSVGGLTVGLKHGFLSEDCVRLDARNLAFSVTFAKMEFDEGSSVSSVSLVLDTEFSGVVRFSRLQDVLCFKAVWLDRIPIFTGQAVPGTKPPPKALPSPSGSSVSQKSEFTTAFLIRIRQIKLDVDLGQSISAVTLDLKGAFLRTKLTETTSEVSMSVADVAIVAKGNVAGRANVPNCVFQTIRRRESNYVEGAANKTMLELRMTSGALIALLESDHQKLLHYRAEPLEVEIFDNWSMISSHTHVDERPLRLSFVVSSPEIVAVVTVGTIPKLLSYANKFKANLEAQREGASRESKAFRGTRTPKPDNPLSAVANAMLTSARSRFKEAENGLSYVISQHMSLRLDLLRLVVFPRTMADLEIAQFVGRDVHARLDRLVEAESLPAKRDLHLSFSSMTISRFTQLHHTIMTNDGKEWLMFLVKDAPEAIIVGLPSMNMHMFSEETMEELTKILVYDFHSQFVRREGMKDFEDIYITLNMSLYSWLTVLRKNLSREMDQVRATAEWRTSLTVVSPSATSVRRKVPEPLQLADAPRSMTIPRQSNQPTSAFTSPSSARTNNAEQIKSASSDNALLTSPQGQSLSASPPSNAQGSSLLPFPSPNDAVISAEPSSSPASHVKRTTLVYRHRSRHIERLTMRQLGEATPDVMHPFFMKKAGFNLEDSLPQYVNEYATAPLEEIMEILLKLYSRQLMTDDDT